MAYTLYIRPVLIPIFASAVVMGGAFTTALNSQPGFESRATGQQELSNPDLLESGPSYSPDNTYGRGPVPDWVVGFSHIFKPEYFAQAETSDYQPYQGVAWTETSPVLPLQSQPDSVAQAAEVFVADDEGGREIDNPAHRPDPAPQFREPQAERAPLDRTVEFDHADRSENTDIDDARQVTASL